MVSVILFIYLDKLMLFFIQIDKLSRQHGIHIRDPSHELRSVCFTTFHLAFDSKRQKFISLALNGMQVTSCYYFGLNIY